MRRYQIGSTEVEMFFAHRQKTANFGRQAIEKRFLFLQKDENKYFSASCVLALLAEPEI